MTAAPLGGLFEAHLTVEDLDRSVAFYRDVVGLEPAFETGDRNAAFLWAGGHGRSMLGLWVSHAPLGLSLHVAFRAPLEDVLGLCERLRSAGVTPLSFFATETDEPTVIDAFVDPEEIAPSLIKRVETLARFLGPAGGRTEPPPGFGTTPPPSNR